MILLLALSCQSSADLRLNELISIIGKFNEVNNFSKSNVINVLIKIDVIYRTAFQFWWPDIFHIVLKYFLMEIVIDGLIGKTKCNAILVEFQIHGSPHIHSFLWIVNAPTLTKDNKEEYIGFVENIIHVTPPHEAEQPELYKFVTTYGCSRPEVICKKMFLKIS